MSTAFSVPKLISQTINGAQRNVLQQAAETAAEHIQTGASDSPHVKNAPEDLPLEVLEAVLCVYVEAKRDAKALLDSSAMIDWMDKSSAVRADRAEILANAFPFSSAAADGTTTAGGSSAKSELYFLPKATGLEYTVAHQLGDRTQETPERSLPAFEYSISTVRSADPNDTAAGKKSVDFTATAEQAQHLLSRLQDMVREAQRVAEQQ